MVMLCYVKESGKRHALVKDLAGGQSRRSYCIPTAYPSRYYPRKRATRTPTILQLLSASAAHLN